MKDDIFDAEQFLSRELEKLKEKKRPYKEFLQTEFVKFVENYLKNFPPFELSDSDAEFSKDKEAILREEYISMALEEFIFERFLVVIRVVEPTDLFVKTSFSYAQQLINFTLNTVESKLESDIKLTEILCASMRDLKTNKDIN
jgi:hypothetical protein